ncbi:hypothetical protein AB0469_01415 [Streptomyces sp. NPDC093801]|uniref:hypothetical protein n=1 Tax=Streptomyces sp. NPDC093801 TaxID=3155203 RepID=UPI00344D46B1
MPLAERHLTLRRDPHSGEVLARGGDAVARSILERTGFVPVIRHHDRYHRLPKNLDRAEEEHLATRAVARLQAVGYTVEADTAFATDRREPRYPSLGAQVAHLASRIREADTTEDVAGVLTELTAEDNGILPALAEVLAATADFYQHLGDPADPSTAKRLRYLAEERLAVIDSDVRATRNALADRHSPHPHRHPCPGKVGPGEREASAACPCPVPVTTTPPSALRPAPAVRRR